MLTSERLHQVLEPRALDLPPQPHVTEIRCDAICDSLGDDALQVIVVLDGSTQDEDRSWERIEPVEGVIREALRDAGEERFPYIRFRTPQELLEEAESR
jgi:hypothetical protein